MRIAICDDERNEQLEIENKLIQMDGNYVLECFESGEALLAAASKEPYFELVFLDIYLDNENGIEVAKKLQKISPDTNIVFVTTSQCHAVEAFSVQALHYLVKPLKQEDILKVFERMGRKRDMRHTLAIKIERTLNVLYQDEILKVESQGHRTIMIMMDGTVFSMRKSFHEVEELLDDSFLNIKRSVTVNMYHIVQLRSNDCTLADGTKYLLQRNRKAEIRKQYYEFCMKKWEKKGNT